MANTLEHEPCRPLRHVDVPPNLVGANAVLAIGDQEHSAEPFIEPDGGIFEDRSHLDGELLFAVKALPYKARVEKRNPLRLALGATRNRWVSQVIFCLNKTRPDDE